MVDLSRTNFTGLEKTPLLASICCLFSFEKKNKKKTINEPYLLVFIIAYFSLGDGFFQRKIFKIFHIGWMLLNVKESGHRYVDTTSIHY